MGSHGLPVGVPWASQNRTCLFLLSRLPGFTVSYITHRNIPWEKQLLATLFFVIYVAPLHAPDGILFRLSYVDDFSLTVASTSYEQNSHKLITMFDSLIAQGTSMCVLFAPEKTEVDRKSVV